MSILATASNEPVTGKKQLVEYFAHAAKPKEKWLIGCEHEKFPFRLSTLKPVSYEEPNGLRDLYQGMEAFGWAPVMEGENIIGLSRAKAAISFEPGGQVELAGSPFANLHDIAAETDQHFVEICEIGDRLGIGFLGIGFHPTAKREDISWVPKQRYKIMRGYMPKVGTRGLDMMLRTCTVQVNLDFSSEADMVKKFRTSLALQPIATALSSPPRHFSKASRAACKAAACMSGSIPIRIAPARRNSCMKAALVSSAIPITRSMCRCISFIAPANISIAPAKASAISCRASCPPFPVKSRR